MTRLALGTVQFGLNYGIANQTGQMGRNDCERILALATRAGIDVLDTAISYGDSEERLGEVGVATFRVVTKLPQLPEATFDVESWVRGQLTGSLGRLKLARVYALLLHRPADLLGPKGAALLDALRQAKGDGLVEKVGVSIYAPHELSALLELHPFDLVQAPLSLVDRRLVESGWLDRLAAAGVEVHTRSVYLQGLLLLPLAEQQRRFPAWTELWRNWHSWLRGAGGSAVAHCLAWPLAHPGVTRVIVGADTPGHLQAAIDAAVSAPRAVEWPPVACDDEDLVDPSRWRHV